MKDKKDKRESVIKLKKEGESSEKDSLIKDIEEAVEKRLGSKPDSMMINFGLEDGRAGALVGGDIEKLVSVMATNFTKREEVRGTILATLDHITNSLDEMLTMIQLQDDKETTTD